MPEPLVKWDIEQALARFARSREEDDAYLREMRRLNLEQTKLCVEQFRRPSLEQQPFLFWLAVFMAVMIGSFLANLAAKMLLAVIVASHLCPASGLH